MKTRGLSERFASAWQGVGATTPAPFARIERAYSEAHRAYHTLEHIDQCLTWLDWCWSLAERPHEVALAIWYHDIVYDPLRRDNEALSAQILRQELETAGAHEAVIQRISLLIEATAGHTAQAGDAALLVDIDLTILGAHEAAFARFEQAVREEYRMFDDQAYARGRTRVLEKLLAREPLFATSLIAAELTAQARRNLERAIEHWSPRGDARA